MDTSQLTAMATMILMAAITPVINRIIKLAETLIPSIATKLNHYYKNIVHGKEYRATIKRKSNYSPEHGWLSDWSINENMHLIDAILEFITVNKLVATSNKCNIGDAASGIKNVLERLKTRKATYAPTEVIKYQDVHIEYDEYEIDADRGCKTKTIQIIVSSRKSMDCIDNFINTCYNMYITRKYGVDADKRYMFSQVKSEKGNRFKKYVINNKSSFESIFYPEKDNLMQLLDKLLEGKLNKLGLLFYGEPGCGKTSSIKAIAKYTGRHVINVKLSLIKNDADLMDVFHNDSYMCYKNNDESFDVYSESIPADQRIYILEDIDAECAAILERANKSQDIDLSKLLSDIKSDDTTDKKASVDKPTGVTLSGILNVLDGVLELNGAIVIMTTNFIDKLDSALIRPGRITMRVELGKMLTSVANQMVKSHYGTVIDNIQDNVFTPATLESLIQQSSDINHLIRLIDKYQSK